MVGSRVWTKTMSISLVAQTAKDHGGGGGEKKKKKKKKEEA